MEHIKFRYMSTGEKIFTIVDYLLLTFVLVVIAYPIIYIVSASFSSPEAVIAGKVVLWPVDVTLRGYKAVFRRSSPRGTSSLPISCSPCTSAADWSPPTYW